MSKKDYLRLAVLALSLGLIVGVIAERLCVNAARAGLLLTHAGLAPAAGPINPASVPGLAMWYDPSDTTTVWQDPTCNTTPATNGTNVFCIKDKGPNGCNMTRASGAVPLLTVVSSTEAFLTFNGAEILKSTCLSVLQNVPRSVLFLAGMAASSAASTGSLLYIGTNASATGRLVGGYDLSSSTGWGVRARRLDADSGVNVVSGTASGAINEFHSVIEYLTVTNNATVVTNPGASSVVGTVGDGTTSSNTQNLPSITGGVNLGADDTGSGTGSGNLYQVLLYAPTSSMSAGVVAQLDTFTCGRAGLTC